MLLELLTITEIISPKYEQPKPEPVKTVQVEKKVEEPVKPPEPVIEQYIVVPGDSLSKIAKAKNTTVERLWSFNLELNNQNLIYPNQVIKIPPANAEVAPRALVEQVVQTTTPASNAVPRASSAVVPSAMPNNYRGFEWGWCTYYAQLSRPDKSFRGNAKDWIAYSNSSVPQVGAVAVSTNGGYGHVGIVIGIRPGEVQVRHMNYRGFGVVSEDWTSTGYWSGYIN